MDQKNFDLDKNTADDILHNVLDTCRIQPSEESVDRLMLRRNIQKSTLSVFKFIAIIFLILAILCPLTFKRDPAFSLISSSKNVTITSHTLYDSCFIMILSGSVEYSGIHAKKDNGSLIYPDAYDVSTGSVIFPYDGDALNIYIPSTSGECIQAVLAEHK